MTIRKTVTFLLALQMILCSPFAIVVGAEQKRSEKKPGYGVSPGTASDEEPSDDLLDTAFPLQGLDAPVDPDAYIIGPSDEFVLLIRGQTQQTIRLPVLPEGVVMLPNLGAFHAAGMTITEFKERLFDALAKYYKNIDYDCQLLKPRSFVVYVLGEVKFPGPVELRAPFRAATALNAAGGTTNLGSLRYVELREEGRPSETVDLFSFFGLGEVEKNVVLREGQNLFVPVKHTTAVILGEVWNDGSYEIYGHETVADLIRFAGGTTSYANDEGIMLERYDASGRVEVRVVPPEEIATTTLRNQDVVVVPDLRSNSGAGYVEILGGGSREGRVYIEDGETLEAFLPRFVALSEDYDLSRAVVERRDKAGGAGVTENIPVNLEEVIQGKTDGSLELQPGDVISIPSIDVKVYVTGEVVNPGAVEYQRGLPAERYIALAGGPTDAGSIDKLTIYASEGVKRDGGRESMVYRGDTILVRQKTSRLFRTAFVSLATITSLALSIYAVATR